MSFKKVYVLSVDLNGYETTLQLEEKAGEVYSVNSAAKVFEDTLNESFPDLNFNIDSVMEFCYNEANLKDPDDYVYPLLPTIH